ncbi:Ig-like domain-containing protein [Rhizobium leguminosarum]|uniref:Ig-like domain-containing protein n=1 Tax=Rhizobium leguminosarum TaxID=384 RepID=UPI001C93B98D|nr:Ig-like domain-containing protein [Rhizobium leguminosarum]
MVAASGRPVAGDDLFTFSENAAISGNLLANDTAGANGHKFLRFFDGESVLAKKPGQVTDIAGEHGVFHIKADGSFTYTLNDGEKVGFDAGEILTERISYKISDGAGHSDVGSLTLRVNGVTDAPVAEDATYSGDEDHAIAGQLAASDPDGDALAYSAAAGGGPAHGAVTIDADGSFTYTPDADWFGADSFSYQVADGHGGLDTATATLNVAQLLDDPHFTNVTQGGNASSGDAVLSADGSALAFVSDASNLTAGNTNGRTDIFFYDSATHALTNVTQGGNFGSTAPDLAADGTKLAFASYASNLPADDTGMASDIFLYDTASHAMTNVTFGANNDSTAPDLSADGTTLAFSSLASNLTPGDTNGNWDVFLYQTASHAFTNVTQGGNGASGPPVLSPDGSKLAFTSPASNLTPGDSNGQSDIFLYDTTTHAFTNVTEGGNGQSRGAVLSADGSKLAFYSYASNLTPGDTNGSWDVFLYDTDTHTLTNVTEDGNGGSTLTAISADGSKLVFESYANTLTPGDTTGGQLADIFLYDIASHGLTNITQGGNGLSGFPDISADGSGLVFYSNADNLTPYDSNGRADVFFYDWV